MVPPSNVSFYENNNPMMMLLNNFCIKFYKVCTFTGFFILFCFLIKLLKIGSLSSRIIGSIFCIILSINSEREHVSCHSYTPLTCTHHNLYKFILASNKIYFFLPVTINLCNLPRAYHEPCRMNYTF
jgi:hypothetical protein